MLKRILSLFKPDPLIIGEDYILKIHDDKNPFNSSAIIVRVKDLKDGYVKYKFLIRNNKEESIGDYSDSEKRFRVAYRILNKTEK